MTDRILVTGASGNIGGGVVERLRQRGLPVRALVLREDGRAATLRALGAEVVVGDLTSAPDVVCAMTGCRRMYFGLGVTAQYLDATATTAAVARAQGDLEVLVNMSQMTVSQMTLTSQTESAQQRLHWLAEQVLNWSGLPVVHVRPTIFEDTFLLLTGDAIARDGTIQLPFGHGRTSPIDASDVADAIAVILASPETHLGRIYELTGPRSETLDEMAADFSAALGRPIRYVDVPYEPWRDGLRRRGIPEHLVEHLATIARLHSQNRYDRLTGDVERITGHPATTIGGFVARHASELRART